VGAGDLPGLAAEPDQARLAKSKAVPAHLGLTPKVYQSGEIDRSGRISKSGDQLLRHLLTEAAASMLMRTSKWCALKHWGVKLAGKIGMGKAVVAVARKMAIIMHTMWLTGEVFRFGAGEPVPNTP
jgi:transposase